MEETIAYILWCLYAFVEGKREAYYFADKIHSGIIPNEHVLFTIQRAMVLLIAGILNWYIIIPFALAFPFFHDGSYYLQRNRMNDLVYPKRWKDQSTTTTARISLNYPLRLWMFILSLALISLIIL